MLAELSSLNTLEVMMERSNFPNLVKSNHHHLSVLGTGQKRNLSEVVLLDSVGLKLPFSSILENTRPSFGSRTSNTGQSYDYREPA